MNKVWLIFGGSGFVGTNLILNLIKKNKIICVDINKKNNTNLLKLLSKNEKKKIKIINKSIIKYNDLESIFRNQCFDIIVNLAALTSVNETSLNPKKTLLTNVKGFENILQLMKRYKKNKIIYASSCAVYGENRYKNNEKTKLNPKSFYGKTKIENEKIASEYYNKYKISSVGMRFSNIYGRHQRYNSLYSAVITKWINLIKYKKSVIFHDNKNILRDFCHVNDVVSSIKLSYKYIEKREKADLFNIAYGRSISLKILFKNILKFLQKKDKNMKPEIKLAKTPKENIIVSKISIEKAKIKLNYKPKISIIQGLCLSFK
jgi:nucleoside-diphosphate-sugar epimerase